MEPGSFECCMTNVHVETDCTVLAGLESRRVGVGAHRTTISMGAAGSVSSKLTVIAGRCPPVLVGGLGGLDASILHSLCTVAFPLRCI